MKLSKTLLFLLLFLFIPILCSASENTISWEKISMSGAKSIAFSDDGKYLAALEANGIGIKVFIPEMHKVSFFVNDMAVKAIFKIKFLSGSNRLNAITWDKNQGIVMRKWDVANKSELIPVKINADTSEKFSQFLITPNDKYIVGITKDKEMQIFSATDGSLLHKFNEDGSYPAKCYAFSNSSKYIAGMLSKSIYILDLESGSIIKEIPSDNGSDQRIIFSANDSLMLVYTVDGGSACNIYVYDANTTDYIEDFRIGADVKDLLITPDNKYIISAGTYLTVTDLETKSQIRRKSVSTFPLYNPSLIYSQSNKSIALINDNIIELYNFDTYDLLIKLPGSSFPMNYLLYSNDNKSIFTNGSGIYKIINNKNGEISREFKGGKGLVDILPDSNLYYYTKDSSIILADVYTDSIQESFNTGLKISSVGFSNNKKYAFVEKDLFHSFMMNWVIKQNIYDMDSLYIYAFSPFDNYMITGKTGAHNFDIRIPETGESIFSDTWDNIRKSAFSSDEKYLVIYTKNDYKIKLYNLETKIYEKEIKDDSVNFIDNYVIKLSRDNRAVIYACINGDIIIRSFETGEIIYKINYFPVKPFWFDVSPDEKNIAVTYSDGSLIQYEIPSGILGVGEEKETAIPAFSVSPNPASDIISINATEASARNNTIEIFDQSGKLVTTAAGRSEIDISTLPTGVYYVRMDGKVQKIVKVK